jgi:hypothetical protein
MWMSQGTFPEGEDTLLMFTSYEGNFCFIIPKSLKDVHNLNNLSRRKQQIISGIENTITEQGWQGL